MSGLYVDHASLDLIADHLRATVAGMESRLDDLARELAPLSNEWQGSAQAAFSVAKARWDTAIAGLVAALDTTRRAVLAANEEYRAADLRGAQAFGG